VGNYPHSTLFACLLVDTAAPADVRRIVFDTATRRILAGDDDGNGDCLNDGGGEPSGVAPVSAGAGGAGGERGHEAAGMPFTVAADSRDAAAWE